MFRLESSILTRAKRATNQNNVATEKRGGCIFRGGVYLEPKNSGKKAENVGNKGDAIECFVIAEKERIRTELRQDLIFLYLSYERWRQVNELNK